MLFALKSREGISLLGRWLPEFHNPGNALWAMERLCAIKEQPEGHHGFGAELMIRPLSSSLQAEVATQIVHPYFRVDAELDLRVHRETTQAFSLTFL